MAQRVVVGLSGGVDSSIAAYLLKKEGYDVIAVFMINWHDTTGTLSGDCPWNDDLIFAQLVARNLDIPIHIVDFSEQYHKRVVNYMFHEYEQGRTPNPDVLCNREVKFDLFINEALKYNADFVATGHYCRKDTISKDGKTYFRLLAGLDPSKEQSYFLCQLNQKQLEKVLFPIGHLHKKDIRKLAKDLNLATAEKKDSQGICFVGKIDLPTFLQQKLKSKEGNVYEIPKDLKINEQLPVPDLNKNYTASELEKYANTTSYNPEDGFLAGKHDGAHFYTIGQRKGLNIGGRQEPLFVLATNVSENIIYVGQGHDHPGLNRYGLYIAETNLHWIRPDLSLQPGKKQMIMARIRYRQPLQTACLYKVEKGMYILFEKAQRGITSGQFAAWYIDDELIGSGVIA